MKKYDCQNRTSGGKIWLQLLLLLVCRTLEIVENFKVEFEQIDIEGEYMSVLIAVIFIISS